MVYSAKSLGVLRAQGLYRLGAIILRLATFGISIMFNLCLITFNYGYLHFSTFY